MYVTSHCLYLFFQLFVVVCCLINRSQWFFISPFDSLTNLHNTTNFFNSTTNFFCDKKDNILILNSVQRLTEPEWASEQAEFWTVKSVQTQKIPLDKTNLFNSTTTCFAIRTLLSVHTDFEQCTAFDWARVSKRASRVLNCEVCTDCVCTH